MTEEKPVCNPVHCSIIAGNCVEALCSPTSFQTLETVLLCQKAIQALLDDPWPRSRIGTDQSLAVELLNVLHRSVAANGCGRLQVSKSDKQFHCTVIIQL